MTQASLFPLEGNPNDVVYTPSDLAFDIVSHFKPSGRILEPAKGDGAFLKHMPTAEYCELQEGKDFFAYTNKVNWIVSNPPFSIYREWLEHSFMIADNCVYLVPLWKTFVSSKIIKMIAKYGGIREIYHCGSGSECGFDVGFAMAAIHYKKDYKGEIAVAFRERANNRLHPSRGIRPVKLYYPTPEGDSTRGDLSSPTPCG